jgi:hypothetical protein
MTRSFLRGMGAALLGALAALALMASAHAGGWSVVVLDSESALAVGGAMQAGVPVEIGFTVLQHGDKPVAGLTPQITLTPENGGAPVAVSASAAGKPGHYVATIALPAPGSWRWEIEAFGPPSVMAPIRVAAAPAPVAPTPAAMPVVLLVAAVALGVVGLIARNARRPAVAPQ